MILTWVYAPERSAYTEWLCEFVEERGGRAELVRLYCDVPTLERRVERADRRDFAKLTRVEALRVKLKALVDPFAEVSSRKGLSLSTQIQSADEVAAEIVMRLELPTKNVACNDHDDTPQDDSSRR